MARRRQREIPPCSKTYGFPIYCAAWVPMDRISAAAEEEAAGKKKEGEGEAAAVEETAEKKEQGGGGEVVVAEEEGVKKKEQEGGQSFQALDPNRLLVALGGGGGEGRSGVPNVLLIAELRTDADVPYRMAVHPGGDGVVCAGTVEGDITILSSLDMRAQMTVKKAHLGIVTALAFTQDS
ncbi:hypothetical protein BHE74_00027003, partial [Ensete ventricosum]